jgi:hypothetical protein
MEQSVVNVGNVSGSWKRWVVVWLVLAVVASVAAGIGFLGALTGTAGLFFVYHGIQALRRSASSRSVERTKIGSLGGRREAVQIVGRAQPDGEPLTAPVTDTDCVAYELRVKEYSPSKEGGE